MAAYRGSGCTACTANPRLLFFSACTADVGTPGIISDASRKRFLACLMTYELMRHATCERRRSW
eukprot:361046-Chlamydomonas_euryale.AAC.3